MRVNRNARRRVMFINLFIAATGLFMLLGLLSLALRPEATTYIGGLFSGCCFIVAFLMIRHKILKRLNK